jgi:hypothetical protein
MPYLGNEPAVAYTSTTKDTFSGDALLPILHCLKQVITTLFVWL